MPRHRVRPLRRRIAALVTAALAAGAALVATAAPATAEADVVRVSGANRYETAVEVAAGFDPGVERVYIAAGGDYPDALAGAPAATLDEAPVLLVTRTNVPAVTAEEIERLDPAEIVVLGGTSAVSGAVLTDLRTYAPTQRLSGENRYATSVEISRASFEPGVETVYIASGADYPDALSVAPVAGADEAPILLVQRTNIPEVVRGELERLNPGRIVVLGGSSAINGAVTTNLKTYTDGSVSRWQGANRYETSAEISKRNFPNGADAVFLATGIDFPDALAGGPLAALSDVPILLVQRDNLPNVIADEISRLDPEFVFVLGGTSVISKKVADQAADPTAKDPSPAAAAALAALDDIRVTTTLAPGYDRDSFGGWTTINGCDTRNRILIRDLTNKVVDADCKVQSGVLKDPYTGTTINFVRGPSTSADVQIDHVVSLSQAWKMGANRWSAAEKNRFYNDAANLLAVDGRTNNSKSDKTLGEWRPPNSSYHCKFTITYITVTDKYNLALKPVDVAYAREKLPTC